MALWGSEYASDPSSLRRSRRPGARRHRHLRRGRQRRRHHGRAHGGETSDAIAWHTGVPVRPQSADPKFTAKLIVRPSSRAPQPQRRYRVLRRPLATIHLGRAWQRHEPRRQRSQSVWAVDLDGDNTIDALSASLNDDTIAWYQNDGTSQKFLSTSSPTKPMARPRCWRPTSTWTGTSTPPPGPRMQI